MKSPRRKRISQYTPGRLLRLRVLTGLALLALMLMVILILNISAVPIINNVAQEITSYTGSPLQNVLFAGVAKSGTTSLTSWLLDSFGMCGAKVLPGELDNTHNEDLVRKEVHFYDKDNTFQGKGIQFYKRKYDHCSGQKHIMDGTPDTVMFPDRVYSTYKKEAPELLSALKIIVTLREPSSRELSWYNHMVDLASEYKKNNTKVPNWIKTVLDTEKEASPIMNFDEYTQQLIHGRLRDRLRQDSFYAKHLIKWFELFDRQQILILSYDEVKADPDKVQWRIKQFLGLKNQFAGLNDPSSSTSTSTSTGSTSTLPKKNQRNSSLKQSIPSCKAQSTLADLFEPEHEKLYLLLEANSGPCSMEQHPFPKFRLGKCIATTDMKQKGTNGTPA